MFGENFRFSEIFLIVFVILILVSNSIQQSHEIAGGHGTTRSTETATTPNNNATDHPLSTTSQTPTTEMTSSPRLLTTTMVNHGDKVTTSHNLERICRNAHKLFKYNLPHPNSSNLYIHCHRDWNGNWIAEIQKCGSGEQFWLKFCIPTVLHRLLTFWM